MKTKLTTKIIAIGLVLGGCIEAEPLEGEEAEDLESLDALDSVDQEGGEYTYGPFPLLVSSTKQSGYWDKNASGCVEVGTSQPIVWQAANGSYYHVRVPVTDEWFNNEAWKLNKCMGRRGPGCGLDIINNSYNIRPLIHDACVRYHHGNDPTLGENMDGDANCGDEYSAAVPNPPSCSGAAGTTASGLNGTKDALCPNGQVATSMGCKTTSAASPIYITDTTSHTKWRVSFSSGQKIYYAITNVEQGATCTAAITGGTGNVDLYAKFDGPPTETSYGARSISTTNIYESVTLTAPYGPTSFYIMVKGVNAAKLWKVGLSCTGSGGGMPVQQ